MTEVSMLVYPWDLAVDGVDSVVGALAERGVRRIQIATAYHSAEVISPRRGHRVSVTAEANRAHLPIPHARFSDLALPESALARETPDLFDRVRVAADAAGIAVDGWIVAFHNSSLATERPDAAQLNCFGDRFTHGLCPASPAARSYAVELFEAILAGGRFDRVLAESVSYLLAAHGHPHELWGARLDPTTRYLVSLCFCEHCVAAAGERGIDGDALRERVARELTRTWNADLGAARDDDDGRELASLLLAWPDLASYTRMRMETVDSLVAELQEVCRRAGTALDVSAAVWGRPAPMNWLEGVDLRQTLATADGVVLESYHPSVGEVVRELDHVAALRDTSSRAELTVALTLWPAHHDSLASILAKAQASRRAGAERLALYNFSTATERTLSWVPAVVAEFEGGDA